MVMGNLVHTSTVLLRRARFQIVGGFDETLKPAGEDFGFHLRTWQQGPVAFADVASIRYQVGCPDRLIGGSTASTSLAMSRGRSNRCSVKIPAGFTYLVVRRVIRALKREMRIAKRR